MNPNGVDPARFRPDGPRTARSADPLVLDVGRLSHQRGPDIAVAALALMRTPSVRLRLVGDGPDRAGIERQAATLGVADRVELAGRRPDTAPDVRAADVVVVPARYDGMALVTLEAMACGAAIVATRVAGSSCLDGAGILVPPEDPRSLAEAVDALLAMPGERKRLGSAARAQAVERYPLERSVEHTLALWRELGVTPAHNRRAPEKPAGFPAGSEGGIVTGGETHAPVTLASIARILWRQKIVSAGVFLLIFVIGCTVVLVRPRTYESSSSIALLPVSYDTNVLQNYPNLIGSLIPTYVQLVSSPALLDRVAAGLPFHTSGPELANQVSAQSLSNAAVIDIVARSGNPTQARQIAAETTRVFLSQLQGNGVVEPQIYGLPSANPTVAPPGTSLLLTLVFVLALVFALAAGLIWERLPPATSAAAADLGADLPDQPGKGRS